MMFIIFIIRSDRFAVVDRYEKDVSFIMHQSVWILFIFDLVDTSPGTLFIFQFYYHGGDIRMFRRGDERNIRVSFSGIHLRYDRVVFLRRIVCETNRIA